MAKIPFPDLAPKTGTAFADDGPLLDREGLTVGLVEGRVGFDADHQGLL